MNPEERPLAPEMIPEPFLGGRSSCRPGRPPSRPAALLHLGLLLATVVTTIIAGALQQGVNPLETPGLLYRGIPFSFTLLLILGTHEMGHYLVSRRHHLDVTLPYFIPAPPIPFIIGTFGAFIRIRSPIKDKRALLDVGCAGPLTGVLVSIPVILVGLKLSTVTVMGGGEEGLDPGRTPAVQAPELAGPGLDDAGAKCHPASGGLCRLDRPVGHGPQPDPGGAVGRGPRGLRPVSRLPPLYLPGGARVFWWSAG